MKSQYYLEFAQDNLLHFLNLSPECISNCNCPLIPKGANTVFSVLYSLPPPFISDHIYSAWGGGNADPPPHPAAAVSIFKLVFWCIVFYDVDTIFLGRADQEFSMTTSSHHTDWAFQHRVDPKLRQT
jgi:hypothetical protein